MALALFSCGGYLWWRAQTLEGASLVGLVLCIVAISSSAAFEWWWIRRSRRQR